MRGSPSPSRSLIASTAWMAPMIPGRTPRTPASADEGASSGGWRLGHEAPVARAFVGVEDRGLALEAEYRTVHDRDRLHQGCVVEEITGREVVRPVDDHVVGVDDLEHVARPELHV